MQRLSRRSAEESAVPLPLTSMLPDQIARQLAWAILALLFAAPAWAAPLLVTSAADDGPGSLREAVTLANARSGHDIIMFDAGLGPIELHSGQIDITEPLTLRGPKDGQLISGRQASRILAVTRRDIELHLENMILSGARTDQPGVFNDCSPRWGQGAALCSLGDVSLVGSHITDNLTIGEAAHGAGLFVRGRLIVKDSMIATNQTLGAMAHGAGISAFGAVEIINSIIAGNAAIGRLSAGGGLSGRGEVLLSGTRVNENIAWAEAQTGIHLGVDASLTINGIQPFDNFSVIDLEPKQGRTVSSALPRREAQLHPDGLRVMLRTDERHKSSGDASPQVDEWRVCSPPGAWGLGSVRIFFGSPEVGESSATWILTVFNNTDVSAEISSVSLSGNHPGDFEILTDNCTNTTLNNSSCEITLNATPQAGGERTARVDIESDATRNRFVPLYVGGQAELSLTPALLDFGAIEVDAFADQTVMVENTGDGTLALNSTEISGATEFGVSATTCPGTLSPGASCSYTVRVQPTEPGELEGQFIFHSNAPSTPDAVTLVATACIDCPQAGMSLSPSELDFGPVSVGETGGPLNLTVSNTGTATLNVHSLSAISAPFTLGGGGSCGDIPFSLDSGASCILGFSFSPVEAGSYVISPQFSANVPANPAFTLLGVGTEPVLELDRSDIDFGSHPVGGSAVGDGFTISNAGTADLDIGTLVLAGDDPGDFQVASDACSNQTLAPAAQCAVGISAEPQAAGTRTARIDFTSNAASSPHSVSLDVEGLQAELVLSDTLLDFGNVPVGQIESMSLTVANSGSWELEIDAITPSAAPFDRTGGSCPEPQFVLAVGEQCSLEYSFAPTGRDSAEQPITVSSSVGDAAFSLEGTGIAPVLEIDADGIDFGDVEIGTSASENLLLENTGDIALVLGELLISGPDAAGFTLPVDDCSGQSLPPAAACSVTVTVTPSLPGPLVAQIDIPSNALSTPDAVTLSATGTQADIDLAPAELDFGPVPVGQTAEVLTLTVSNPGTATLVVDALSTVNAPFAPAGGSCGDAPFSVATGESCTLEFSFSPIEAGPFEEIIEVSANVPANPAFTLLGVGTEPVLELDRSDIDFGSHPVGGSAVGDGFTISNVGTADLDIGTLVLAGDHPGDFQVASDACSNQTLAPAAQCAVGISAEPQAAGTRTARIDFTSNAASSPHSVSLDVEGLQAELVLSDTLLDFGNVPVGQIESMSLTVANSGSWELEIDAITPSAAPFDRTGGSCPEPQFVLAVGEQCSLEYSFAPTGRDSAEQPITVSSSVGDAAFSLEGTGIAPVLEIDADGIDFGDVEIGTSASENLLLENTGDIALVLGELLISGPDAAGFTLPVDDCSGQSLPPAAACSVTVTVTPSLPGPLVAQIDIPSNALSTPDAVTLSATGTQADIDLAPAELDFGPVPVGQTAEVLTLTVSNPGTATLVVDALSTVNAPFAPAGGSCGDAPFSVATGESCTLEFSFSPIEAGPFEEIIEVSANVPANPAFTLLGVGTEPVLELDRSDIDFGPVAIGSDSAPEALVLHNSGSAELAIAAITLSGDQAADFALADDGCSHQLLAPATSCTLLLTVTPSDVGRRDAVLEIASNASTTMETVELTATGAQGMLSLDLTILDLGLIAPGAASSGVATLSNIGSVPLQLDGISAPAEPFTLSGGSCLPVPTNLDAGESCAIEVRFAPLVGGEFSGNILIDSNSPTSPDTIVLSGQAIDALPVPALNPMGLLILILLIAGIGSLVASRMGR
jgi:hypothetical protein